MKFSLPDQSLRCFSVAYNTVTIDPKGKLYKCYKESKYNRAFGTIFDNLNEYNNNFLEGCKYDPFKRKICKDCSILPICHGGCYDSVTMTEICSQRYLLGDKIRRYFEYEK